MSDIDNKQLIKKALKNPIKTLRVLNRRYLQIGMKMKDSEINYMKSWSYGKIKRTPLCDIYPELVDEDIKIYKLFSGTSNMSVTVYELACIVALERLVSAKNVLEIGTYNGRTTLNLAANLMPGGKVYTVDLPKKMDHYGLNIPDFYYDKTEFNEIGSFYKGSEFEKSINQIFEDSANIDYKKLNVTFDLAFIDGNHSYEYIKNDTESVLPFLKKGGIIIWHDYGMLEEVTRYLDEVMHQNQIKVIAGTRLAFMRK